MTRAERCRELIDRHLADRSSSPFSSITEIHMAVTGGEVPELGAEPGSLESLMQ